MFKMAICPRISWSLYTMEIPLTWIERTLEPLATRYLKKWSNLSYCAAPQILYLPTNNLGLSMPAISTMYKTLQTSRFTSFMCSQDNRVRRLVEHKAVREGKDKHHKYRSSASTASIFEDVVALGGKSNNMKHQIKSTIQLRDVNHRLDHLKSCGICVLTSIF